MSSRGGYESRGGSNFIGRPHPLKNPFIFIPLVIVGAMVYTHHPDQGAALAKTVGNTYGTTAGIGVGTAPDALNGFSAGLGYMGTTLGGAPTGTVPTPSAVPQAPAKVTP